MWTTERRLGPALAELGCPPDDKCVAVTEHTSRVFVAIDHVTNVTIAEVAGEQLQTIRNVQHEVGRFTTGIDGELLLPWLQFSDVRWLSWRPGQTGFRDDEFFANDAPQNGGFVFSVQVSFDGQPITVRAIEPSGGDENYRIGVSIPGAICPGEDAPGSPAAFDLVRAGNTGYLMRDQVYALILNGP